MSSPPAREYVAARRALLDVLFALRDHHDSLVLVGAQAVYIHTGDVEINVPLMTTDADLVVNTQLLSDEPEIATALRDAGFRSPANPGHWISEEDVAVDLMVVPHQAGTASTTARAARIPPHAKQSARIARGLEPALVDHQVHLITSLDAADGRSCELRVAGPAALLTAKAIKLGERLVLEDRQPERVKEKDALDVFRLLQATETLVFAHGVERHRSDANAGPATDEGLGILRQHGALASGRLPQLAATAAAGDPTVAPSFAALVTELLRQV